MFQALIERVYKAFILACFVLFFIGLIIGVLVPWDRLLVWIKSLL